MTLRLLISARDTGAAHHLGAVARRATRVTDIELTVAASQPALDVLRSLPGLTVRPFGHAAITDAADAGSLLAGARALLGEVRPDALLVGLSGPGAGIDEALAVGAGAIPTFLFQDFWGDLNTTLGFPNVTVLALDQEAARITRAQQGLASVIVGAPGYERFADLDIEQLAADARRDLKLDPDDPLLTVCGQPLWEVEGYAATLESVGRAAPQAGLMSIAWRPHPKETTAQQARAAELLGVAGADVLDARSFRLESLLGATDVLCSAFSNCGTDLIHLGRVAETPLGTAVFALFEPSLRDQYQRWTGLSDLPLATAGLASTVHQQRDLVGILERAAQSDERRRRWDRIARWLPDPAGAAERILDRIRDAVESGP